MRSFHVALLGTFAVLAQTASAVTIDFVTVGDPGNACDVQSQGCFGSVAQTYLISKTEVTNAQYAEFLNAKAHDWWNLHESLGVARRNRLQSGLRRRWQARLL